MNDTRLGTTARHPTEFTATTSCGFQVRVDDQLDRIARHDPKGVERLRHLLGPRRPVLSLIPADTPENSYLWIGDAAGNCFAVLEGRELGRLKRALMRTRCEGAST